MRTFALLLIAAAVAACSHNQADWQTEHLPLLLSPHLANPRRVEGEIALTISNIAPLTGSLLSADNTTLDLPPTKPPELHIWMPQITERFAQRDVQIFVSTPPAERTHSDPINQNNVLHWDLTPSLVQGGSVTILRRFAFTGYEVDFDIDRDRIAPHNPDSALFRFYTKPERLIESDNPAIQEIARRITEGIESPYDQAHAIFNWVCDTLDYHYPPEEQGAAVTLERCAGDCRGYSFLFIAMCRAAGIPARQVSGVFFTEERSGQHVWAEFFLPGYGWVPADPSEADSEYGNHDSQDYFAHLPNDRLTLSVGTNIPIQPTIPWATWENSDVQAHTTDYLQLWTQASNGFDANFNVDVRVLRSDPLTEQ